MRGLRRILALGCVLLAAAGAAASEDTPPDFDHLIVVSIDTLRADFLGCYGHPFVKTPNLDRLASEGVLFEQHVTAAPTTLVSHASLMTGRWPRGHGTPRNGFRVPDRNRMLAEVLAEQGFDTAAFIGAFSLHSRTNFGQGFAHIDQDFRGGLGEVGVKQAQRPAPRVNRAVLEWLDRRRVTEAERLFLFVHYFDVHAPYVHGPEWDGLYRDDALLVTGGMQEIDEVRQRLRRGEAGAEAESLALRALYAAGVSYADHHLGLLLHALAERGVLERSLLVVTSDHGEAMDEHEDELWDHGRSLFDATQRTPLIVRFPGAWGGGRRVTQLVSNVDVMPTLLELLGLAPGTALDGVSLAGLLAGGSQPVRELAFAEATKPHKQRWEQGTGWLNERKARAVRSLEWKLVDRPYEGHTALYDVAADPGETRDLLRSGSATGRAPVHALWGALEAWAGARSALPAQRDPSPQSRELLEALGYLEE